MEIVALLRAVTPTGKNQIPKMSYLREILEDKGFKDVKTFIQSGNIILDTPFPKELTALRIHEVIKDKIGADLKVIIKVKTELATAVAEAPFSNRLDRSRVHLFFTNERINADKLRKLLDIEFGEEDFAIGVECLYAYLPRTAIKKRLNINFLEKKLSVSMTMRKINVIEQIISMCK